MKPLFILLLSLISLAAVSQVTTHSQTYVAQSEATARMYAAGCTQVKTVMPPENKVVQTVISPDLTVIQNAGLEVRCLNRAPVIEPDPTPVPDPIPDPVPDPTPDPVAWMGVGYSYTNDIATAQPLAGAVLEPVTVYFFVLGDLITSVSYYCCKGVGGTATGEPHQAAVQKYVAPFSHAIDLSQFATPGTREMYFDYNSTLGNLGISRYANFTINTDAVVVVPDPNPVPPVVEPDPVVNERIVQFSWLIPDAREDGTALAPAEIYGYKLYWHETSFPDDVSVIEVGPVLIYETVFLTGSYSVTIATVDTGGLESQPSDPITVIVN